MLGTHSWLSGSGSRFPYLYAIFSFPWARTQWPSSKVLLEIPIFASPSWFCSHCMHSRNAVPSSRVYLTADHGSNPYQNRPQSQNRQILPNVVFFVMRTICPTTSTLAIGRPLKTCDSLQLLKLFSSLICALKSFTYDQNTGSAPHWSTGTGFASFAAPPVLTLLRLVLWLPTAGRESDDEPPVCDTWCLFIFKVNGKTKKLKDASENPATRRELAC